MTDLSAYLDAVQGRADAGEETFDDEGAGCCPRHVREFIAAARSDVPAMVAVLRAVVALHKPWRIYDECEHSHPEGDPARVDCGDFTSCDEAFMYEVCHECCQENGYITERCADSHRHGRDEPRCATIAALSSLTPDTPRSE